MKTHRVQCTSRGLVLAILLLTFHSCNFSQSIEKDLVTGLSTRGDGLSCEEVYLSDGEGIIQRNTFIYGETFFVNFDGIEGFEREEKRAFPEMQLAVVSDLDDTVLFINDMYEGYEEGMENSPLELYAVLSLADPIHSGGDYTLSVNIRDQKGTGSFRASLDFDVVRDENIALSSEQLYFGEIYLFSQQRSHTITDGRAGFNENIYLLFEGLEGFAEEAGQVHLGLSLEVKDADGTLILNETDLYGDTRLTIEDVHAQIAPNFILTGSEVANPVTCKIRIWDKKSTAWIEARTEVVVN